MKILRNILFIIPVLSLSACSYLFSAAVYPDRCEKCEVIDQQTSQVLYTEEGCAGDAANVEDRAKVKAFDLSRSGYSLCNLQVRCTSYAAPE